MDVHPPPNRHGFVCCEAQKPTASRCPGKRPEARRDLQTTVDDAESWVACALGLLLGHAAQDGNDRRLGTYQLRRRSIFSKTSEPGLCHVLTWWTEFQMVSDKLLEHTQQRHFSTPYLVTRHRPRTTTCLAPREVEDNKRSGNGPCHPRYAKVGALHGPATSKVWPPLGNTPTTAQADRWWPRTSRGRHPHARVARGRGRQRGSNRVSMFVGKQ